MRSRVRLLELPFALVLSHERTKPCLNIDPNKLEDSRNETHIVRIRDEEPLPDDAVLVRGGVLERGEVDDGMGLAQREWQIYGISAFCILGLSIRETYEAKKQLNIRFDAVRTVKVGQIRALGFRVIPTAGLYHYTIDIMKPLDDSAYSQLDQVFSPPIWMRS